MIVRFFAQTRQITGCSEVQIEAEQPMTGDELWEALLARFPALAKTRANTRLARNHEFAAMNAAFTNADEVALIPPVSGG